MVSQGESVEFRVRLDGPGAVASVTSPIPSAFQPEPGERIEALTEEATIDPPSRTFRARIRMSRPGDRTLPPVRVSWFDPDSATFQTSISRAIPLKVVATPQFDRGSVVIAVSPTPSPSDWRWVVGVGSGCLGASAFLLGAIRWKAARRRRTRTGRLAERIASRIRAAEGPAAVAREAGGGLGVLLHELGGRSPGVLTPEDAYQWVSRTTGNNGLADRARKLIFSCDRVLYGEKVEAIDVRDQACTFVVEVARAIRPSVARETSGASEI